MARKKDLGSLAALAGLAYMASRDKATKGGDIPVDDRSATPAASSDMEDTEFGDLKGAQERAALAPDRAPASPRSTAARAPSASSPSIVDQETGMRAYKPRYTPPGRAPKAVAGERPSPRLNAQELDDYTTYKKGGSVKGWGAARGARKAKIY